MFGYLLTGGVLSTHCYVCGGQSVLAEKCVDEYHLEMREDDKQDCSEVLGHTEGCMKSKYVDLEGRQISKCLNNNMIIHFN